ncbi:MAG: hypothetical protein ACLQNE_32310 [Thermoguttaceae bacterium]
MSQPTLYQYVKLGSNLEFLRGLASVSMMQTTSLVAFPHLMENLPSARYSLTQVIQGLKALMIQLEEMKLLSTLAAAKAFSAMLREMEEYAARVEKPQAAYLNDQFADRLVAISENVATTLRIELSAASPPAGSATSPNL